MVNVWILKTFLTFFLNLQFWPKITLVLAATDIDTGKLDEYGCKMNFDKEVRKMNQYLHKKVIKRILTFIHQLVFYFPHVHISQHIKGKRNFPEQAHVNCNLIRELALIRSVTIYNFIFSKLVSCFRLLKNQV